MTNSAFHQQARNKKQELSPLNSFPLIGCSETFEHSQGSLSLH